MIQGAFFQRLEGHFIRGYGDRNRNAEIYLIDSAGKRAREYLANNEEETQRLQKMSRIIKGFENPYGVELLSTVHWILKTSQPATEEELIMEVQNWNERKKQLFPSKHIKKAYRHLKEILS